MITKLDTTTVNDSQLIAAGDIEHLLSYYGIDDKIKCNLNTGIVINADDTAYETFHLTTSMFWPQISQLIYGTTSLYWLLEQLNSNLTTTCFDKVEAPAHIRYLPNAIAVVTTAE